MRSNFSRKSLRGSSTLPSCMSRPSPLAHHSRAVKAVSGKEHGQAHRRLVGGRGGRGVFCPGRKRFEPRQRHGHAQATQHRATRKAKVRHHGKHLSVRVSSGGICHRAHRGDRAAIRRWRRLRRQKLKSNILCTTLYYLRHLRNLRIDLLSLADDIVLCDLGVLGGRIVLQTFTVAQVPQSTHDESGIAGCAGWARPRP